MNLEVLTEYGIDHKAGVARCLNDAGLYEKLLTMFLKDESFTRAGVAAAAKDREALYKAVHELKGASGSVSITGLFAAACALLELLKSEKGTDAEIAALFLTLESEYMKAREGVTLALRD